MLDLIGVGLHWDYLWLQCVTVGVPSFGRPFVPTGIGVGIALRLMRRVTLGWVYDLNPM